ncbi:hypothetical protein HRR83_002472 [Exophiala dermatitidis]|uniref:Uncharacterized protein n=2 Tax=Exophiala dermatitidis TaxID=5970 RepID=H6C0S2_EXODN|nr:uncharacterized protein HMPREF1120_04528 [Exophiala dermatitidis NIH/UT8656]KAJ4520468.1 hypothetical protein HRR75_002334 [Exophiala dermatitidis]EHY56446.1 hypothetical protein HMPREF1120_04528 [Exophiala dermatitidis NIH/UT8656]KAJ4524351.1 hypothetical protein HRR74_002549 [Exophiala dermatitidis]KAJ4555707.1 hypothetical protein HRR77_001636 [Exophiala dermatitidis]KAJ4556161.1 hypothetical protein HRR78_001819 [Exophiala dermatitidis]
MGLRARLRKRFSSSSKMSSTPDPILPNEPHYTARTDIEYYKPHEIPRSKYRGKVDPEHQASLAAFSLADAFSAPARRNSMALSGTFSPGGTKAQSLAASRIQSRAQSRVQSRVPSRRQSFEETIPTRTEEERSSTDSSSREKSITASTVLDRDTPSTSLSERTTPIPSAPVEPAMKLAMHDSGIDIPDIVLTKQTTAHDTPFTVEELEQAMTRASLGPRRFAVSGAI